MEPSRSPLLLSIAVALAWPLAATAGPLHPSVEGQLERFTSSKAGFTTRGAFRAKPYLPMIREQLRQRGLPVELAWLPLAESGFRPDARSRAGAVGLWQLMPATARRFGLRVDEAGDDRLDPELSTRAAADYLAFLARSFPSWPLVLAAYNAGEGRIGRLLDASGAGDFWALRETGSLPQETENYVPTAIALSILCEGRQTFER